MNRPFFVRHRVKLTFVIIGIWNTVFGYAAFFVLDTLLVRLIGTRYVAYMTAMVLSNIISILNAYVCHKYVTFRSHVKGKGMVSEFIKFSATYVFAICLSLILMPAIVEIVHLDPKIAAALVILITVIVSYIGHSRFSFASTRTAIRKMSGGSKNIGPV